MRNILRYTALVLFLLFLLVPIIEMIFTSLQSLESVFSIPHPLLPEFHFETYTKELWEQVPRLPNYLFNSIIISLFVTFLTILLGFPAGYSLSRFRFPGRNLIMLGILAVNMFSPVILLVPLYKTMTALQLLNTYTAMILPGTAFVLPFCIWMLSGYFQKIPKSLEESAFVDGATRIQVMLRIILPIAAPGFVTVSIYAFIVSWSQQFIFALTFATKREIMPVTRGIYEYFGQNINYWNTIMGASVLAIVPVLLIFIFLQKYLISGLTAGAVKG
jgi:multiple sugar transport system permease protein